MFRTSKMGKLLRGERQRARAAVGLGPMSEMGQSLPKWDVRVTLRPLFPC